MSQFDQRTFRAALGRFATGVTIITARGIDGRPVGVTANSFNSVSLDPPLVLWSLAKTSNSRDAFESADEFAIHVLGLEQEDLSNRFATGGLDKFEGLDLNGAKVPLLEGCAARFHCRKSQRHDVGDHILFIGEVVEFDACDDEPLLYLQGKYGEARRREAAELGYDLEAAQLGTGALLNLFSRAHVRILSRVRTEFARLGIEESASIVLAALAEGITNLADVGKFASDRDFDFSKEEQERLVRQGMIAIDGSSATLLKRGRDTYGELLSALKNIEEELTSEFTAGELSEARSFLARIGIAEQGRG